MRDMSKRATRRPVLAREGIAREGRDLHAFATEERDGGFVGTEEAVGGDEGEQHVASHCSEGDTD